MRVLVTGGLGYLGSGLIRILKETSKVEEIVVLDNQRSGRIEAFYGLNDPRFRYIDGDISDVYDLDFALEGVDCLIHLAALVNTPLGVYDGSALYTNNINGTEALMEKAKAAGVSDVIFASSLSVYGPVDQEGKVHFGLSPYPKSKLAAEKIILDIANNSGMNSWILRCGILYGKAPVGHFDSFVNGMVLQAALRRRVTVFGSGQQRRGVTNITQAASTIKDCLNHKISPGIYDVFDAVVSPLNIVEILRKLDQMLEVSYTDQDVRVRYDILPQGDERIEQLNVLEERVTELFRDYTLFLNS
ncbi:MAG: NAD-dependent epimerase/dehydratase family protein [Roseivirga sp.]|nr:NAD-dependent epimerase/dehydratase family protein [Roseivirga sp.]